MAEILRTERLTKRFQGLIANESIDFTVASGGIRCLIGPNGAGKTTLLSIVSGHLRATSGRIWFEGEDITRLSVAERARRGISRKFQTPSVFDNLTAFENAELAVLATPRPARARRGRVLDVLDLVRLGEHAGRPVRQLSHGQRQWLEIGLLIANDAKLMLLDEPTAGMTAEESHSTGELLRRLVRDLRLSAIIVEHDIRFVRSLAAPVVVLHLGRVLVEGTFEEVEQDPRVREVYLGNA